MANKLLLLLAIYVGKAIFFGLNLLGRTGTALPGNIALRIYPDILKEMSGRCAKIAIITGTNGKTTTNNLINHILWGKYSSIVSNLKGANMVQGVVTGFVVNFKNSYDWGIFEVDEGSVPVVSRYLTADYIVITNFFRDQLDRFGEVDNTIKMVYDSLKDTKTKIIVNADDPSNQKFSQLPNEKIYYGVIENQFSKKEHTVAEAIFCPNCGNRLSYEYINYGNVGKYSCNKCELLRNDLDYYGSDIKIKNNSYEFNVHIKNEKEKYKFVFKYMGLYNIYNCIAAISFGLEIGLEIEYIENRVENFVYKLGRMETIEFPQKDVILILSKNPIGLSEVLSTISYDEDEKSVMFILNYQPADGQDISWIWDADIEQIANVNSVKKFYGSGERSEEVILRIKYAGFPEEKSHLFPSKKSNIEESIKYMLNDKIKKTYVIATFTAMPEARKILYKLKES